MSSIHIKFKVKFVGNLVKNDVKLQIHLDKAFMTKSTIVSTQGKEVTIQYDFPKFPDEARTDPCVVIETYRKRKQTFTRTAIYKVNWFNLIQTNIHQRKDYVIPHNKPFYKILISGFEIKGDFKHDYSPQLDQIVSKSIDEISTSIFYFLDNNFDFTRLDKVAIFYRDDLMYRMDLLSQLIVKHAEEYSNQDAWLNLLAKLEEAYEFVKDMKTATKNTKIMKKPRPIDVKTSWVDLICYIVTRGYNYRTDYPKDNYSEPSTNKAGDCVATYEEIYTTEGLKTVGDLKVGDVVLSYDFKNKKFTQKPITTIWEKGVLPRKRVVFTNGSYIDVTSNHPFWTRLNQQGNSKYGKVLLKDIDFSRFWKKKVPTVKKLPYITKDNPSITEDHCFLIGFFLADGWNEGHHTRIGSNKVPELIVPLLKKQSIAYSSGTTNHNIPYVTILKSKFKYYLKGLKRNSFDMELPKELMSLPTNKLQKILDGYFEGDGHFHKRNGVAYEKIYSCSCEMLVNQFMEISLKIGNPLYKYKQEKHGGLGKKTIYRLHDNQNSFFKKDFGYEDLSEVGIKKVIDLGSTKMRDFEIQDTHSYIFRNGVIGHNCEDLSLIILAFYQLFTNCDFSKDKKYLVLMEMQRYARRYIPWFTFCLTGSQQFGAAASVPNSSSGHICAFFISKVSYMNNLKDENLKRLMILKDKPNLVHEKGDRHYLIGEGTNLVRPFIKDDNYDGFDPITFNTLQKMLQIQNIVSYETVDDNITVRVISDPNSDFYRKFGMLFTPYFYNLNPQGKNVYYGVVCATKNTQIGKKPFYGIDFEDFNLFSEKMSFYPLPPLPNQYVKLSEKTSRYQTPLTLFKLGKNGFESSITEGSELFYPKFKVSEEFNKKLQKYEMSKELNGQFEMRAYSYLSDEDMKSENIRLSLLQFMESNNIKMKYIVQELNNDTNTHLFGFYTKKQDPIPYVNIVPVSNKFLVE